MTASLLTQATQELLSRLVLVPLILSQGANEPRRVPQNYHQTDAPRASRDDNRERDLRRNEGLVNLLLSCPVKGWFRPLERKETAMDIKTPAF